MKFDSSIFTLGSKSLLDYPQIHEKVIGLANREDRVRFALVALLFVYQEKKQETEYLEVFRRV